MARTPGFVPAEPASEISLRCFSVAVVCALLSSSCATPAMPAVGTGTEELRHAWGQPTRICNATDPNCEWLRVGLRGCDPAQGALAQLWLYDKWLRDDVVVGVSVNQRVACAARAGMRLGQDH